MANMQVTVVDGNNLTVSVDRGVSGVGIESVSIVYDAPYYYLDFLYTNGTNELVQLPALAAGVTSFNTRIGVVTLESTDVTSALGYVPVDGPASSTDNAIVRFNGTNGNAIQNSGVTIDDSDNVVNPRSLQFSGTVPATQPIGTLWFDSSTDTLNLQQNAITQQIGEELYVYGKASSAISGQTLLQAIYKTGTVGASGNITFAPTIAGLTDGGAIIGVATEDIATNGFGRITNFGIVHSINTSGSTYGETWADGDDIWYNPVTGGLTKTKPVAPNIKVQIGTVIHAGSGGSGSFQVLLNTGSVLGGTDSNVQITSPASGNALIYDATAGYWKNANLTDGTGINITEGSGSITIANTGVTSITGTASQITASASTGGVTLSLPSTINVNTSGNAGTVTNGVYTTGSYSDPTWIASLSGSKVSGNISGNAANVTGVVAIANGGTGQTTANAAFNALAPSQTGNSGKYLTTDGTNTSWASNPLGTVTSVAMTTPTGLTVSGSPITTSGTLAVSLESGYSIPTTASQTNWDSAYTQRLQWDGGSTNLVAATGRTSLGGTTVGQNFFTLTNPTAVTFPRINADNTVSTLDAATFRSAIGAGTSSTTGTVTSVSGTGTVSGISLSGTVTSSGSLTLGGSLDLSAPPAIGGTTANTGSFTSLTASGNATAAAFIPSSATVPTNGLYLPTTNTIAFATASTERMRIDSAGRIGIGATPNAGEVFNVSKNPVGDSGGVAFSIRNYGTIQSSVTNAYYGNIVNVNTQATAFTLPNLFYNAASQGTIGAGSAVTSQYGFHVNSTLTGATNNYGFYSNIASGTGRYNFYAAGSADNYFAGKIITGTDNIQINTAKTPASASASGTTGQVCWDSSYVYVCVATNTWKRVAIATW